MSGLNLLYPVMAALVILMPLKPRTIAGGLLLVALFGIGGSVSIAVTDARKPEGQTRQLLFYRYFVPLPASSALAWRAGSARRGSHGASICRLFRVCDACNRLRQRMGSAAQPVRLPGHRIGYATETRT
jgi:hypothetical protein